jgi:hypothetical protein
MTPTWEFNAPYYAYLSDRVGTSARPQFTFIPHHMLFQPHIFIEANMRAGIDADEGLLQAVIKKSADPSPSSFCLIYELYAQWLVLMYWERVRLERWSNRFVQRSKNTHVPVSTAIEEAQRLGYCSVSFHSWS